MPEIQIPDLARKLSRRFGITGGTPAATLAPEIVPVTLVADLTTPDEEDTGYEKLCMGVYIQAGAAGNNSHSQLFNRANSGIVGIVSGVLVDTDNADGLELRAYDTACTTAGDKSFVDRRLQGAPTCTPRGQNNATLLGTRFARFSTAGTDSLLIPLEIVLPPGRGILVVPVTQNNSMVATWYWAERAALDDE